jgi:glycosyltransferase involved in cell wall biosynthesis
VAAHPIQPASKTPLRVALVHDWLTGMRGGEYVLEAIAEMFPKAELFTLLYVPGKISPTLTTLKRHTSWLQKAPDAEKRYRHFLPLLPRAIESFDLTGFDLVISTSHCVAKGIRKPEGAVHVSYVFAPMRYMWGRFDDYFGPGKSSLPVRLAAKLLRPYLQKWDRSVSTPERVDSIVTLSRFIAGEIREFYGRDSTVIYPFANLTRFQGKERRAGKHYLMVGAFAPYKRVDLAVEAFNRMKLPLLIVGSGQDERRLKKLAGPTVEFLGSLSNAAIDDLYAKCKAFVFPGVEDFGITPLEAMAAGAPVIAYAAGGALENVSERTGIFFKEQTVESLCEAVEKLERGEVSFDPAECRKQAALFNRARFQKELAQVIEQAWVAAGKNPEPLRARLEQSWAESLRRPDQTSL